MCLQPQILALSALLGLLSQQRVAYAQHAIDVERLTAKAQFFEALTSYDRMPTRITTTASTLAAARSAWALGLTDRALVEFENAYKAKDLDRVQAARILFTKGVIEFQESHYQVASLYAEKAITALNRITNQSSPLRAKMWLLWGQALAQLKSYGPAEEKCLSALAEASLEDQAEIHFWLGETRIHLGKLNLAKEDFQKIPLSHERTASAVRSLAELAIETEEYERAAFWLEKGRADFAESFLDSWVDYALIQIAIHRRDREKVRQLQEQAQKKYPPSDPWLTLLNAAAEGFWWSRESSTNNQQ